MNEAGRTSDRILSERILAGQLVTLPFAAVPIILITTEGAKTTRIHDKGRQEAVYISRPPSTTI